MRRPLRAFAVCAPGVEEVCAAELRGLGLAPGPVAVGGVPFAASVRELYLANRWLRTAHRVLVRLGQFTAFTFDELSAGAAALAWDQRLRGTATFRVSSTASNLFHTEAIAERVAAAAGIAVSDDGPVVVVRVMHDRVTVSVDSSGESLHRRPWRTAIAKAPLRPSLAAAVLLASGWEPGTALADPFCGSGTIPIEAALLARGLPPGGDRTFGFHDWPSFEPGTWGAVRGARPVAPVPTRIGAADRDAGAIQAAAENAARAGVADAIAAARSAISDLRLPPGPGWVVTNPPYGERIAHGGDLRDLYARLGQVVAAAPGWRLAVLTSERALAAATGLSLVEQLRTTNGGIPVALYVSSAA